MLSYPTSLIGANKKQSHALEPYNNTLMRGSRNCISGSTSTGFAPLFPTPSVAVEEDEGNENIRLLVTIVRRAHVAVSEAAIVDG